MTIDLRPTRGAATRFRGRDLLAAALLLVGAAGCDIPTEPPQFESRWIVPAEETRFGVAELLPADVTLTPDSSAFLVTFDPVSFSRSLGGLCPACVPFDGLNVPKPAFFGEVASGISFPPEVVAIQVIDGAVELELFNGFNFDPIRPAAGAEGSLEITITDSADGDLLGSLTLDGATTAFPPGATLTPTIDLLTATVDGGLNVSVAIDSPTGDPVTIDTDLLVSAVATPTAVRVGSVEIDVAGRSVTLDPVSLDVEDIDLEIVERVVEGAFVLDVVNPFAISADFQITISGPTIATIQKSVTIGPEPTSSSRLTFTGAELQSFLGKPGVTLSGSAVVDAGAGTIVVDPGEELVLEASLDITLRIGG